MGVAILSIPKDKDGCIVEAGSYKGGSTAKFSLFAKLANREILINCTSQTDVKIPRMHTAIQCDIVFNDGVDWVESNKIRFWDYVTLLEVAEYSVAKDVVWVDL